MSLITCTSPLLKEKGTIFTNSFLSGEYSGNDSDYLLKTLVVPPSLVATFFGLRYFCCFFFNIKNYVYIYTFRCLGLEGPLANESANYSLNPPHQSNLMGINQFDSKYDQI